MNRYLLSFLLTLSIYTFIIAAIYYYNNNKKIEEQSAKKSLNRVKITILSPKTEQKQVTKKTKHTKQKHKKKKIIKNKANKKVIKKIKCNKCKAKKIKTTKQQPILKKQLKQTKSKAIAGVNQIDKKLADLKKQQYYELIKQTIYKNKKYPKIAKQRGIFGIVKVKFTLDKEGKLKNIKIVSGNHLFYSSVKEAIKKSFPLPPPKNLFNENINISLNIKFILN